MTIEYTLDDLSVVANQVIKNTKSNILLFDAEMGAGKTTLIKEISKQLGVTDAISSPTYALVNEYHSVDKIIYHFDFYRIQDEEEAFQIGFEEYLDTDAWIFIEWPEKVANLLPLNAQKVEIKVINNGKRVLFLR
ncbi:tRNA (adenosine(37)-N6)-threonylcarbamoyltransferase complex ATPase subunit type 1 TsaE [Aquimarina sp. MMG016]|uniref:tRNA (adenosine(37)-N6)-threonylcarbamoyltransferase complex ATPase subunit type 1 TsaE n=1 Tax=Aquimarina sp. MMG016 TaxID=2822690 RepID=UPI001B3A0B8B|nr:tRNA (adenosine(37)-N6)-threonylcarbamoyltransferase complex ATPase subunit type 1 TsaE [Aquimarina sp. MMG016]MBQ4819186.1 tRNA (adenosine(37)-N6)-threonylcarbamoyltransferase complex ATPase subunit type 1 TsaE [Aquimarina sp. MMG016]